MNKGERQGRLQEPPRVRPRSLDDGILAIAALKFFAEDLGRAERFFTWSGLDATTIRAAAGQPGFGIGILQFLMQDEPLLLEFAKHAGLDPADVAAACQSSLAREGL